MRSWTQAEEGPFVESSPADEWGPNDWCSDQLFVVSETSLEKILQNIQKLSPSTVVVDSIQTVYSSELTTPPGSIGQVREASSRLLYLAKHLSIPIFIIGHVTKEGFIAGPKVLEHMVDTVLLKERQTILRIERSKSGPLMRSPEMSLSW
jgi:DNA repair protein RadA/Sms